MGWTFSQLAHYQMMEAEFFGRDPWTRTRTNTFWRGVGQNETHQRSVHQSQQLHHTLRFMVFQQNCKSSVECVHMAATFASGGTSSPGFIFRNLSKTSSTWKKCLNRMKALPKNMRYKLCFATFIETAINIPFLLWRGTPVRLFDNELKVTYSSVPPSQGHIFECEIFVFEFDLTRRPYHM